MLNKCRWTGLVILAVITLHCSCAPYPWLPIIPTTQPPAPSTYTVPLVQTISNVDVFFPRQEEDPAIILSNLYGQSTQTLDIAIYSLTHPTIVRAIIDAKKRGVVVRVITDKIQAGGKSQKVALDTLLEVGIPCKVDNHSGLMHLKMSIVDKLVATTGSYNYSMAASEDNDEIFVIIRNDSNFIQRCISEFDRMWKDPKFTDVERSY